MHCGSGAGTNGRVCLGRPGLNPSLSGQAGFESQDGLGLLQFRIAVNLFSLGVGFYQKKP